MSRAFALILITIGLGLAPRAQAQELCDEVEPLPARRLPAHLLAPEGRVSLLLDRSNAADGKAPCYIVNRSAEELILPLDSYDSCGVALEAKLDGRWRRAEVCAGELCEEYFVRLGPGMMLRQSVRWPSSGRRAWLRLRCPGQPDITTRPVSGFVSLAEVRRAELDPRAVSSGPRELALRALTEALPDCEEFDVEGLRCLALSRLTSFPRKELVAALPAVVRGVRRYAPELLCELDSLRLSIEEPAFVRELAGSLVGPQRRLGARRVELLDWLNGEPLEGEGQAPIVEALEASLFAAEEANRRLILEVLMNASTGTYLRVLDRFIADPGMDPVDRRWAAFMKVANSDEVFVDGSLEVLGGDFEAVNADTRLRLNLVNVGQDELNIAYDELSDILRVELMTWDDETSLIAPRRSGVTGFRAAGPRAARCLTIAPGASVALDLRLGDVLAPSALAEAQAGMIWVSVKLDGVHEVGQLIGGASLAIVP